MPRWHRVVALAARPGRRRGQDRREGSGGDASTVNTDARAPLGTVTIALVAKGKFEGGERDDRGPGDRPERRQARRARAGRSRPSRSRPGDRRGEGEDRPQGDVQGSGHGQAQTGCPPASRPSRSRVAPDQSEFTAQARADAKAAAATAKARSPCVFQVAKKDYPVPPAPLGRQGQRAAK